MVLNSHTNLLQVSLIEIAIVLCDINLLHSERPSKQKGIDQEFIQSHPTSHPQNQVRTQKLINIYEDTHS